MPIQPLAALRLKGGGAENNRLLCLYYKPVAVLNDFIAIGNNYLAGSGIGCGIVFVESAALNGNNSI